MPFVKRSNSGVIIALSQEKNSECLEEINSADAELKIFIQSVAQEQTLMTKSDLDFVRVVEDLVDLLVAKNYILFTELPEKAQEKIKLRQELRGKINCSLDLLPDDDDSFTM